MLTYNIGENKQGKLDAENSYAVFSYQGFETRLSITPFVKKMNIQVLKNPDQTMLLNEFITAQGLAGDMNRIYASTASYLSLDNFDATRDVSSKTIKADVTEFCHAMLDLFDVNALATFLVNRGVETPRTLKDSFDTSVEVDLILTKDQTYIKSEYYGLLAIALIIKTVAPIIGEVYATNKQLILSDNETMSFLQFIIDHNIIETAPAKRLLRYINKHLELKTKSTDGIAVNIIAVRTRVTEDTLWELVLANSFFKKFVTAPIGMMPPLTGDVASAVYSIVKNMTKNTDAVPNRVSIKESSRPGDGDDSGSVAEGYTQTTEISLGDLAEINFATSDIVSMFNTAGGQNNELLKDFHQAANILYNKVHILCKGSVLFASYTLHKRVIDARAISHMDYHNAINVMVVAAAICYERGQTEIANMIMLKRTTAQSIATSLSARTATEEKRTAISKKFVKAVIKPKKSRINIDTVHPVNDLITPFVNAFSGNFIDGVHEYILPINYRPDTLPQEVGDVFIVPSEFKTYMIDFLEANLE